MIEIQCTSCQTRYRIDERILPEDTPTFKCSRCGHVFSAEPRQKSPRRASAEGARGAAAAKAARRASADQRRRRRNPQPTRLRALKRPQPRRPPKSPPRRHPRSRRRRPPPARRRLRLRKRRVRGRARPAEPAVARRRNRPWRRRLSRSAPPRRSAAPSRRRNPKRLRRSGMTPGNWSSAASGSPPMNLTNRGKISPSILMTNRRHLIQPPITMRRKSGKSAMLTFLPRRRPVRKTAFGSRTLTTIWRETRAWTGPLAAIRPNQLADRDADQDFDRIHPPRKSARRRTGWRRNRRPVVQAALGRLLYRVVRDGGLRLRDPDDSDSERTDRKRRTAKRPADRRRGPRAASLGC